MAYMNQSVKYAIAQELKKRIPAWAKMKYSLSVRDHSAIVMTIRSSRLDLIGNMMRVQDEYADKRIAAPTLDRLTCGVDVNMHWLGHQFDGQCLEVMTEIRNALNTFNHDNSDIQTDHFDVGYYVDVYLGGGSTPFVFTGDNV